MKRINMYCEKCSLQFDKKYVFDLHLSLVHGENIEVKNEQLICDGNSEEPQINDVLDKYLTPPIAEILCVKNPRAIVVSGFLMK